MGRFSEPEGPEYNNITSFLGSTLYPKDDIKQLIRVCFVFVFELPARKIKRQVHRSNRDGTGIIPSTIV
jgi:hypothetical protein